MNPRVRFSGLCFALGLMCGLIASGATAQSTSMTQIQTAPQAATHATQERSAQHFAPPRIIAMNAQTQRSVRSGKLRLTQFDASWGGLVLSYERQTIAAAHDREWIAYRGAQGPVWIELARTAQTSATLSAEKTTLTQTLWFTDPDGARWDLTRRFSAGSPEGIIDCQMTIRVDREREALYLPVLTFFPGFLQKQGAEPQAIFPGVAWQDGDAGPFALPDPAAIATPLMAVASHGHWFGLAWSPDQHWGAAFSAPDRLYRSGAALCALALPGADRVRDAEPMVGTSGEKLEPGEPLTLHAQLMGGLGPNVAPAMQQYVAAHGLPTPAPQGLDIEATIDALASGWFDTELYRDGEWRSAARTDNAPFYPAADAIVSLRWLARNTGNAALATILRERADLAEGKYPADDPWLKLNAPLSATPAIPLLLGRVDAYVDDHTSTALTLAARAEAHGMRGRMTAAENAGSSATQGVSAAGLAYILEAAALSGDADLTTRSLKLLYHYNAQFGNALPTFPIGGEENLLKPNPLGAAAMIHANLIGHELTGRAELVEQARQWAWRGMAFVRLEPGERAYRVQPTQWCGLVYAAALQRLEAYDPDGPWDQVAAGIARQSLAMSGVGSKARLRGMLPELADPISGKLQGRALSPAHVQAVLPGLYEQEAYGFLRLPHEGWLVHTPCRISNVREKGDGAELVLDGCGEDPFHVLVAGVDTMPKLITTQTVRSVKGGRLDVEGLQPAVFSYDAEKRRVGIEATGRVLISIIKQDPPRTGPAAGAAKP